MAKRSPAPFRVVVVDRRSEVETRKPFNILQLTSEMT
jgi:hypothetical protein